MNLFKKVSVILLLCFTLLSKGFSQQVAVGEWRDELPYLMCISLAEAGSLIYSATPYALFYLDKDDNTVQRLNKINGLSDIGISTIGYNSEYQTLVIAYDNANIDLYKNNAIINISDIKRASILGNKTINSVYFIGKYAYLSCGFGIVVLDIDKEEIKDTYYIGMNGSQVNVLSLTKNNDTLYAATEKGIYLADANSPNLANFASWKKDTRIDTDLTYNTIASFQGEVIVNKHRATIANQSGDTLFRLKNGAWHIWFDQVTNYIYHIESTNNYLSIAYNSFVRVFNPDFTFARQVYNYNPTTPYPIDAFVDHQNILWIGDTYSGLISTPLSSPEDYKQTFLSGPLTGMNFSMSVSGNDLYIAPGGRDNSFGPLYNRGQFYHYDNSNWYNTDVMSITTFFDVVTIAIDPTDSKRIYAGSWGNGLAQFYDGALIEKYNETNSTLAHHSASVSEDIRVGGTAFDKAGNLWVVCSHTNNCLSKKTGDSWTGYNISKVNESDLGQLLVDQNDQKWILMRYGNLNPNSIVVFDDKGTPSTADDQSRLLNASAGSGAIPGNNVYAIAEDKTGQIWVGTEKGIGVFYNPENMFVSGQNIDAQQILVKQGNYYQYLLENEMVTAIAVDGANQKWIGTDRGGVFLFSPDGTQEIYHFTVDNSPLFSNRITAISINPISGDVFFGTDKGTLSFRGVATEGNECWGKVYAFPNPFDRSKATVNNIVITGLADNAELKIVDVSGVLIYSTKSLGGQAVWDGKNFSGSAASDGVYLVIGYTANCPDQEKIVTKILIIN